jgi:hypothetical protein
MSSLQPSSAGVDANAGATATPLRVVLINPYELGRQSFGLVHAATQLRHAGHQVVCTDLSRERLDHEALAAASLIGLHLPMHTATRIAHELLPRLRDLAPTAHLVAYGLYATLNQELLREAGVATLISGEFEPELLTLAARLAAGERVAASATTSIGKVSFALPDRSLQPALEQFARLREPDGLERVMGFAEASRGCKHRCRHCPVVPVYQGRFRVVPADIVVADVRQQVAAGAEHISFGDPDFLNGPTHALRIARALHAEFPQLTFDAVIKIEHLLNHREVVAELGQLGLSLVISAVESVDDEVLDKLEKGHTRADFLATVAMMRELKIAFAPTFVAFSPWTTVNSYLDLLRTLLTMELVGAVASVQLAIRLLIPQGSRLLELDEISNIAQAFDPGALGHPWQHPDPVIDTLQRDIEQALSDDDISKADGFAEVWQLAHAAAGVPPPPLPPDLGAPLAHHTENWYC